MKYLDNDAFLLTAYFTDKIKQREQVWHQLTVSVDHKVGFNRAPRYAVSPAALPNFPFDS